MKGAKTIQGFGWTHEVSRANKDSVWYSPELLECVPDAEPIRLESYPTINGSNIFVWRDDYLQGGLKSRACAALMGKADHFAYVAQHTGHAPTAIAEAAKKVDKRCTFFSACRKKPTNDQLRYMQFGNVEQRWFRIVAMPNLNREVYKWCKRHDVYFVKPGIKDTREATLAIVKAALKMQEQHEAETGLSRIPEVWCVSSTGTLCRALQLALADKVDQFHVVPVARNLKAGEYGNAKIWLEPKTFSMREEIGYLPPFPSVANYDAKAWKFIEANAKDGAVFVNVGRDPYPKEIKKWRSVDFGNSWLEWGDDAAFKTGPIL